jgi:hypothetical protein
MHEIAESDIDNWKKLRRLSLEDALKEGDARAMFCWRALLAACPSDAPDLRNLSIDLTTIHSSWMRLLDSAEVNTETFALWVLEAFALHRVSPLPLDEVCALLPSASTSLANAFFSLQSLINSLFLCSQTALRTVLAFFRSQVSPSALLRLVQHLLSPDLVSLLPLRSIPRLLLLCAFLCDGLTIEQSIFLDKEPEEAEPKYIHDSDLNRWEKNLRATFDVHLRQLCTALQTSSSNSINFTTVGLSRLFESTAQKLMLSALHQSTCFSYHLPPISAHLRIGKHCLVQAPARVDLAGGWSDTPPICFDLGGAVLNVAVTVDGRRPLRCAVRCIPQFYIHLVVYRRDQGGLEVAGEEICRVYEDFLNVAHSDSVCALLKACLRVLGLVHPHNRYSFFIVA